MSKLDWTDVENVLAAALELPEDRQTAYIAECCGYRDELRAEVESLLAAHRRAEGFLRMNTAPAETSAAKNLEGRYLGAYKLIEQVGSGGMGVVYRAERDDGRFHKEVAIKVVAAASDSPELLRRFSSEQQILATLEHPNIARLMDAGISGEGVPYLVMEYVQGVPLTGYCNSRRLSTAGRLQLFRIVCSAVHYAHQHLVVHRDLKPANILVMPCGTPKLLDFGIARLLVEWEGSGVARTMFEPLTPAYASPEQLRGDPLTTTSDVYSLGVILFEVLTGARPNRAAAPPEGVLDDDLEAIVGKAMREDSRERYASAEQLSSDIGAYLDGLPVSARRRTFRYLARKFVARHKIGVAVALAAGFLSMAGVLAIVWEARMAEHQRARAQRRFDDVRQLANSVLFELHDGIASLPGATPVRKLLAGRALHYLDSLSQEAEGDASLQMELAGAYARVGDVQGNAGLPNLGDTAGALASYGKARSILNGILHAAPARIDARQAMAKLCLSISSVQTYLGNSEAAIANARQALAIWGALSSASPADEDAARGVAMAYHAIAGAESTHHPQSSLANESQALAIFERLLSAHPNSSRDQRNLAIAYKNIGGMLLEERRYREAIEHQGKAAELDGRRVTANPKDSQARLDLSFDLSELGSSHKLQGDLGQALSYYRQTLGLRLALAEEDPLDARTKGRVSYIYLQIANVLLKMGDLGGAAAHARKSIQISQDIMSANPADRINRAYAAEAYGYIGDASRADRRHACSSYRHSLDLYRQLQTQGPLRRGEQGDVVRMTRELALCAQAGM